MCSGVPDGRLQVAAFPRGDHPVGDALVLQIRYQLPRARRDDDRARRRCGPHHDLPLGAAVRPGDGEAPEVVLLR